MRRPPSLALLLAGLLTAAPAAAQARRAAPAAAAAPAGVVLPDVSARGRALARFQDLAGGASRVLQGMRPDTARVKQYVVTDSPLGWAVRFGRLTAARDTFYAAYTVWANPGDSSVSVQAHAAGTVAAETDRAAAAAGRLAQQRLGATSRPYNTFVIPAPAGTWWVYLLPAQTVAGVYPHGGDVRYRVSGNGRRILETHRMHAAIVEIRSSDGETVHAHGASASGMPEDSDVYLVLTRQPRTPELFATGRREWRIDTDGSIHSVPRAAPGSAGDRAGRG